LNLKKLATGNLCLFSCRFQVFVSVFLFFGNPEVVLKEDFFRKKPSPSEKNFSLRIE